MEKILTFIIKEDKILLLYGNDTDPQFHESFWYTVTGGVESFDDDLLSAVKREVFEETGLITNKIIDLNVIYEYESLGEHCIEHAFISYVDIDKVKLNEENIDYLWCSLDEFIDRIKWYYDKKELYSIIKKYVLNSRKIV